MQQLCFATATVDGKHRMHAIQGAHDGASSSRENTIISNSIKHKQ